METNVPPKTDIDTIFHRLRSIQANKSCFDCGQKNPTWASVTYGVFICIDCSAVHRGLGVHLTFVRSTNLDTNWTWLQIRNMQCGGNANASAFFRQHNCTTTDAQQKYTSRAATLYRDKLSNSSQQAMKLHGTALHFDTTHTEVEKKQEEEDFFAEHTNDNNEDANQNYCRAAAPIVATAVPEVTKLSEKLEPEGAPSVDFLNSTVTEAPKSTIGVRKVQPKRTGLAKKGGGLGATKVKTNFADIEHRAVMADQIKEPLPQKPLTAAEEEEAEQSVRLAYQDLSLKQQREEEKLKAIDPAKARQMERLGMGFVNRNAVSHSLLTDMKTISQENTTKFTAPKPSSAFEREDRDFFDDYSMYSNGSGASKSKYRDFSAAEADDFEIVEPIVDSSPAVRSMFVRDDSSTKAKSTTGDYQPRNTKQVGTPKGAYELDEAQKKFGSAKGISSDQFFGNDSTSYEGKANLSRFQGSNSISSSDYFGDPSSDRRGTSRSMEFNAPDLDDVKESVKQGVTKVAGRISSLATNVMSSIQDKYGY